MATLNKTLAFKTLDTFAGARVALIEGMKKAGYTTLELAKPVVFEWVSAKTGCPFRIAESSGLPKWDTTHAKYEGSKKAANDILLMLQGTTRHAQSSAKRERDPVEDAIKAFEKLTAAQKRAFLKAIA